MIVSADNGAGWDAMPLLSETPDYAWIEQQQEKRRGAQGRALDNSSDERTIQAVGMGTRRPGKGVPQDTAVGDGFPHV